MGFEDNIRKVTPYVPGEQPVVTGDLIKLNTNEFPFPPSPKVKQILREIDSNELRLYPNVTAAPLAAKLAEYHGFDENQIFVGVGSDDVLATAFLTFFAGKKPILFPNVTYSFYDVWAKLYSIPYEEISVDENFEVHVEDYSKENGGIVLANPNAPTSIALPLSEIEKLVAAHPESVVIIDEAYVDFGGETALPLVNKYKNLLVVRTFSKSRAMAGMRIGYAVGNSALIDAMNNIKFSINSYTMNYTAIACGIASIEDDAYFKETVQKVIDIREWTIARLRELGFTVLPSSANLIFITHKSVPARDIFAYLKSKNVYVRYFDKPIIDNYLRVSMGTHEQMERVIELLKAYL